MTSFPRRPSPGLTFATLLALLLSGCGPQRNTFAPACPQPKFVQGLSDLTRYRADRPGQDITDLVLIGRMAAIDGKCELADEKNLLSSTVTVSLDLSRGPAMRGTEADVPVFVAVTEGNVIRDKQVYTVHAVFPSNVDRVPVTSPPIEMLLPIGANKSGAAYQVIAGFQLTPAEIAANRHRLDR